MAASPVVGVCAFCGKVRNEHGEWEQKDLEAIDRRRLTHGICPACLKRHFGKEQKKRKKHDD